MIAVFGIWSQLLTGGIDDNGTSPNVSTFDVTLSECVSQLNIEPLRYINESKSLPLATMIEHVECASRYAHADNNVYKKNEITYVCDVIDCKTRLNMIPA